MADPIDARGAAIWNDGTPANLRAAAMDALDWLDVLQKQAAYIRMPAEDTRRLMACRVALARQIRRPAPASGMAQAAGEGQQAVAHLEWLHHYLKQSPAAFREWCGHYDAVRAALLASPAVAPSAQPTDDISRAADFLEQYAGYIREVKPEDIERHPYLPELEAVAASLRAIGAAPSAQEPQAAEQSCVVHGLAHPCERCASEISPEVRKDFDAALFRAWANEKGYDIAHTYDTERSRWVFFNPMTADLWACWQGCSEVHEVPGNASTAPSAPAAPVVTADAVRDALTIALDGLDEIALAGMSGTGMESEEGMRDWQARQAWKFIGIAARTKEAARAAMHSTDAREEEK